MRRFLVGFLAGFALGYIVYEATGGWEGSGLVGIGLGVIGGWINVRRGEAERD